MSGTSGQPILGWTYPMRLLSLRFISMSSADPITLFASWRSTHRPVNRWNGPRSWRTRFGR